MNNEKFLSASIEEQVAYINEQLQHKTFDQIAEEIGISKSKISSVMADEKYIYIKSIKRYCKYLMDTEETYELNQPINDDTFIFLEENLQHLKKMIENCSNKNVDLDKRIYDRDSTFSNRNIKINDVIYSEFIQLCEQQYSYLKVQDLVSQALVEFVYNHKK